MQSPDFKAYLAFLSICLIWGTTNLVTHFGISHIPPFLFVTIRQGLAGLIIIAFFAMRGEKLPLTYAALMPHARIGVFYFALGGGLLTSALRFIPTGVASLLCATLPICVALINLLIFKNKTLSTKSWVGLMVGVVGMLLLFKDKLVGGSVSSEYWFGIALIVVCNFSWGYATVLNRQVAQEGTPILGAGWQMFFGSLALAVMSFLFEKHDTLQLDASAFYAMLYLTLLGSVVAFSAYTYCLTRLSAEIVSMFAYINPIIALFGGWLVLGEPFTVLTGVACLVTLSGVYLVNDGM
jgi:drug/metabolite transporter (DMT)-like permease